MVGGQHNRGTVGRHWQGVFAAGAAAGSAVDRAEPAVLVELELLLPQPASSATQASAAIGSG